MKNLSLNDITEYVEANIGSFHKRRLDNLSKLKLNTVLQRKNPYLFKAKNVLHAQDLVKAVLDAHLSSQEETIFGEFLEGLAIFICSKVYNGRKSAAEGIDLEFKKDGRVYLVSIKSGPNWGNAQQIKRMRDNFIRASRTLRTSNSKVNVIAVNGCCYGKDNNPDKGDYHKLCGQRFWELISGKANLYTEIIEPLGHKAKEKNGEFLEAYAQLSNRFTEQFIRDFCTKGRIDWNKLVKFNSSRS